MVYIWNGEKEPKALPLFAILILPNSRREIWTQLFEKQYPPKDPSQIRFNLSPAFVGKCEKSRKVAQEKNAITSPSSCENAQRFLSFPNQEKKEGHRTRKIRHQSSDSHSRQIGGRNKRTFSNCKEEEEARERNGKKQNPAVKTLSLQYGEHGRLAR